jgi:hypothetical protein
MTEAAARPAVPDALTFYTEAEAARLLGCHPRTLARMRLETGGGPRWTRVGRAKIMYSAAALAEWGARGPAEPPPGPRARPPRRGPPAAATRSRR